jgi:hypothetical protein
MLRVDESAQKRLEQARAFADKVGAREELEAQLNYLSTYANGNGTDTVCVLFNDFAPHSFEFVMLRVVTEGEEKKEKRWFNGGLIYFGPGESGVSAPQFSVSLDGCFGTGKGNQHRWSVHT